MIRRICLFHIQSIRSNTPPLLAPSPPPVLSSARPPVPPSSPRPPPLLALAMPVAHGAAHRQVDHVRWTQLHPADGPLSSSICSRPGRYRQRGVWIAAWSDSDGDGRTRTEVARLPWRRAGLGQPRASCPVGRPPRVLRPGRAYAGCPSDLPCWTGRPLDPARVRQSAHHPRRPRPAPCSGPSRQTEERGRRCANGRARVLW
jgi:hypothetical protein